MSWQVITSISMGSLHQPDKVCTRAELKHFAHLHRRNIHFYKATFMLHMFALVCMEDYNAVMNNE